MEDPNHLLRSSIEAEASSLSKSLLPHFGKSAFIGKKSVQTMRQITGIPRSEVGRRPTSDLW